MTDYLTRDLVARRPMLYDGVELAAGDRFRPLSDVDADYLLSRGRADLAPLLKRRATRTVQAVAAPEPDGEIDPDDHAADPGGDTTD